MSPRGLPGRWLRRGPRSHQTGQRRCSSRSHQGRCIAFGADDDVRAAFEPHGITDFDLHTIETKRLRYESGERGLLRDALTRAVARERRLDVVRRRNTDLLAPADPRDVLWVPLLRLVGPLSGTVTGHPELRWREGIGIRLDWADDRLWLLLEPRTVFDGITNDNKAAAADIARERTVKRYNRQLNDLVAFRQICSLATAETCEHSELETASMLSSLFLRHRLLTEGSGMSSEIAPHLWLPEPNLAFHPDRTSDREVHPLRGLLRFGPHSAGLVPDPIRVATLAPAGESHRLLQLHEGTQRVVQAIGARGLPS